MGQRAGKISFTFIPLSGITLYPTRPRVTQKTKRYDPTFHSGMKVFLGTVIWQMLGKPGVSQAIAKWGISANFSSPKSYSKDASE